ncbi:uncharacterized protein [Watersipora subatra]|uniref:uncharacterized protein n=1 Tax=Watersipora subatra TaxID=2589382 RepID=UPI00355AF58E
MAASDAPSLVNAVSKLEDKFRATETELSNLERKMEAEYAVMFDETNAIDNHLKNPVQVMQRIQEVKADFAQVKEDVIAIQKEQGQALLQVKAEFDKLLSSLSNMEHKVLQSGAASTESEEAEMKLMTLIDHMANQASNGQPPPSANQTCSGHPSP